MESTPKYTAQAKYNKNNYKRLAVNLHLAIDKDILEHLDTLGNAQGYVKALIREDMKKHKK